jgi:hypothetical protein
MEVVQDKSVRLILIKGKVICVKAPLFFLPSPGFLIAFAINQSQPNSPLV